VTEPVQGSLPVLGHNDRPPVGQPEFGSAVAPVLHEREPFPAGDRAVRQCEWREVGAVTRKLVVKAEAISRVSDVDHSAVVLDPPGFGWRSVVGRHRGRRDVRRAHRVTRKDVLDIHEQQFLVLLLMVKTEGYQFGHAGRGLFLQQLRDGFIDEFPVAGDLGDARTGDEPALGAGVPVPRAS